MTEQEILALELGEEFNALVAERIIGFQRLVGESVPEIHRHFYKDVNEQEVWLHKDGRRFCKWCGELPDYGENIAAAMDVAHEMFTKGWKMRLRAGKHGSRVGFEPGGRYKPGERVVEAFADSIPEAICKAALLAVLEEESES